MQQACILVEVVVSAVLVTKVVTLTISPHHVMITLAIVVVEAAEVEVEEVTTPPAKTPIAP